MLTGHAFEHVGRPQPTEPNAKATDRGTILADLTAGPCALFTRQTGLPALAVPVFGSTDDLPDTASPPPCQEFAASAYCRESWRLHLAELERCSRSHWHKCDYGMLCGVVPVVLSGSCMAAIKVVCPYRVAEDRFRANVEVLDTLARDFISRSQAIVPEASQSVDTPTDPIEVEALQQPTPNGKWPHTILRAVDYIEAHLSESQLSVGQIASHLGVHADYLSNLFSRHTGKRLTAHMAARRTDRAKNLLVTTRWPVKRVAAECGYANVHWFCQVFRTHAGVSPSEFRNIRANGDTPAALEILDSFQNS